MKLSEVQPAPIEWVWPHCLAKGMLTLLEGQLGEGKSLIALDAAARVTRGWPFPPDPDAMLPPEDRPVVREPAGVLLVSGEDSPTHTEAPRAAVAGADLARISVISVPPAAKPPHQAAEELADRLMALARHEQIALIVIDPLEDAIPGLSTCVASTVRSLARPLVNTSMEIGAALCGVRHFSRPIRSSTFSRGGSSTAISAVARFVFQVVRRPSMPLTRLLACSKSNVCEPPPSLAFDIATVPFGELTSARVDWIARAHELACDYSHIAPQRTESAVARAELFLLERLSDGPVPTVELLDAADRAGLSESSLWRARSALKVRSIKGPGEHGSWSWSLPGPVKRSSSTDPLERLTGSKPPGLCPVVGCDEQAAPMSRFCAGHQPAEPHMDPVCLWTGCPEPQSTNLIYCKEHAAVGQH